MNYTDRDILEEGITLLEKKYPLMFKPSQRCHKPHVNIDNLRNDIFEAKIIKKYKIQNPLDLFYFMDKVNNLIILNWTNGTILLFMTIKMKIYIIRTTTL